MARFNADRIVERAHQVTGVDNFERQSFREGLDILVRDANRSEAWSETGAAALEQLASFYLGLRLRIDDYIRRHPEVLETPIKAPVFVMGIPRTGTTLTSNLLGADPARRSMLTWESNDPTPPATSATLHTDPRALAALEAERQQQRDNPAAGRFYMGSAIFPTECTMILAHDFKSLLWECSAPLPAYSEWIMSCDMASAYAYHRRFLQVLQHKAPGPWNLKMPSHSLFLGALLKTYPDARIVWTHRDPIASTGSLFSLLHNAQSHYLSAPDNDWLVRNYPGQLAEHANRLMRTREDIGHDRIYDLHYAAMMREPIAEMRRLYGWLGDDFTPEAEASMRAWLRANPQGKWGKHAYKLDQWGVTAEAIRPYFEGYLARHQIEPEG